MFRHFGLWLVLLPTAFNRIEACSWKISPSATAGRAEAQGSQTPDGSGRQNLLGIRPSFLGAWKQSLVLVNPETVVRWHRAGFRLYWSLISKGMKPVGRKKLSTEVRELILRMMAENPTWGAPRIHGEPLMLGFQVSERSVSRWMKRVPRDPQPAQRWRAFLRNHREAIAAMDFGVEEIPAGCRLPLAVSTVSGCVLV